MQISFQNYKLTKHSLNAATSAKFINIFFVGLRLVSDYTETKKMNARKQKLIYILGQGYNQNMMKLYLFSFTMSQLCVVCLRNKNINSAMRNVLGGGGGALIDDTAGKVICSF